MKMTTHASNATMALSRKDIGLQMLVRITSATWHFLCGTAALSPKVEQQSIADIVDWFRHGLVVEI
jgi:hypothetical protein